MKISIPVEPVAKARARTVIKGGHVMSYTPKKTASAEINIRAAFIGHEHENFAPDMPLRVSATFFIVRPASKPKRVTMPITRPDLDNYFKLLTDALEKFVYSNDSQITTAVIKKRYSSIPSIELEIIPDRE